MTSSPPAYGFVNVDGFTPETDGPTPDEQWSSLGMIISCQQQGNQFVLTTQGGLTLVLAFLSPTCFRVRFNPRPDGSRYVDFSPANDLSYAVVNRNLGAVALNVTQTAQLLTVNTGAITVEVALYEYHLSVYRPGAAPGQTQLIHADNTGRGLVYIKGQEVIANFKRIPDNALYFGLGEKAGSRLRKNNLSFTNFNFDNFTYSNSFDDGTPLPPTEQAGPLNPAEPLYNSTPFLIEVNFNPVGDFFGDPYTYGIFFDNVAQTYFNIDLTVGTANTYYFGALYGFMDYYFMAGNAVPDVIAQYVQLTGSAQMPPKYVFGYHQGCYGYYDRSKLAQAANSFRAASIPIDGLHIDVDFQNNYRTFTSSDTKFPNAAELFTDLKAIGFKCSTNITSLITANPLDENGATGTPYPARDSGFEQNVFILDNHDTGNGQPPSTDLFLGNEYYGTNPGTNPNSYPPVRLGTDGKPYLGSYGYYPDLGDESIREWWGEQYAYILSLGIEMIWQDMTCPALVSGPGQDISDQDKGPVQVALPGGAVGQRINDAKCNERTFPLNLLVHDITGVWLANARIHNGYAMNLLKATSDGLAKLRPNLRTFIIARGGFAGAQRYGGLWTGDSASSWDFLNINIPEVLNIGLSGQPISGTDIGGFASTGPPGVVGTFTVVDGVGSGRYTDPELLTRWMTMGALLPWYRNHYDGYAKAFQEPYAYPEPVPANCRKWIEIRYRLIQVFYDAMYQAARTGIPIARPLFLNDPDDMTIFTLVQYPNSEDPDTNILYMDTEFFLGHDILVAPILQPQSVGQSMRNIYLPAKSDWYAFQNDEHPLPAAVLNGGMVSGFSAPLDQDPLYIVPVYVRAGAIVPMRQLEQWVGQLPQCPLTFDIYPGPDSTYQLYQDDGLTTNFASKKAYRLTTITQSKRVGQFRVQTVQMQRTFDNFTPPETFYFIGLLSTPSPISVTANGQTMPIVQSGSDEDSANALAASTVNACYYNRSLSTTFIKIFDVAPNTPINPSTPDMVVVATFSPTGP